MVNPIHGDFQPNKLQQVITCTNYDDMILINQKLLGNRRTGERGLMLKDITLRCVDNSKPIVHPISREDLNRYGFDGWALDFVEAPEIVIQMLCGEGLLQQTVSAAGKGLRTLLTFVGCRLEGLAATDQRAAATQRIKSVDYWQAGLYRGTQTGVWGF